MTNSPNLQENQLSTDALWRQLDNAIRMRSAQDQVLWSIFGVFWAANAILLVALFSDGIYPRYVVGTVISGVGFMMSLVWHLIQRRALGHVMRHEALIETIEIQLKIPTEFANSGKVNYKDYQYFLGHGVPARKIMPSCSFLTMILWALGFLFFIIKLLCPIT